MAGLTRNQIVLKADGTGYLQTLLGEYSPKACVLSLNINIFSKVKPIQDSTLGPVLDFKGNDTASGIYYGVQLAMTQRNYENIHDEAFEYHRPRGYNYNEPYRLGDFVGYDPQAVPTLQGIAPLLAYRDIADNYEVGITVDLSGDKTTGIDIAGILQDRGLDLTTCYPMIIVGNKMAALKNSRVSGKPVTPLYYNGAWYSFFVADFSTLGLAAGTSARVSICLVPYSSPSNPASPDFSGAWQDITGLTFINPAYPVPNAAGLSVSIANYGNYPPDLTLSMPTTGNPRGFNIGYSWASEPSENVTMEVSAQLSNTSLPVTKTYTYAPGGSAPIWGFAWTDFGMAGAPQAGSLYDLHVTVRFKYESGQYWRTTTASSTLIVENL